MRSEQRTEVQEARPWLGGARVLTSFALTWFVWVSDSGSLSATDDPSRIPARHRAEAREVAPPALECGRRFTLIGREGAASKCSSEQERRVAQ